MSLKERLVSYLRKVYLHNPNVWIHKGELEQLCKDAGYLGDQGTRRLRELVNEKKIEHRKAGISQEYQYIPMWEEWEQANQTDKP